MNQFLKLVLEIGSLLLVFGLILAIHRSFSETHPLETAEFNVIVGALCLSAICYLFWRSGTSLRGFHTLSYVIPSVSVAFSILLTVYILFRIEYSRALLLLSYVGLVNWFLLRAIIDMRQYRPHYFVFPFGNAVDLVHLSSRAKFSLLNEPGLPTDSGFDGVVVDLNRDEMPEQWSQHLAELSLQQIPVYDSALVYETLTGRVSLKHLGNNRLGMLSHSRLYALTKRLIDVSLSSLLLLLSIPLVLFISLLIRLTSPGPAIFKQWRIGLHGKKFIMYKFRTMNESASREEFSHSTATDDRRVTAVGNLIRKFRIDELPQLYNVIKGDMSLIGPRPSVPVVNLQNELEIPFYRHRHIVRPGITGWAQVSQGYALDEDHESTREKIERDFYYLKYLSLWTDLLIVAMTMYTILTGRGAR